jgi:peptidoglycan/LPS O-acetylase OafA/YrhL
VAEAERVLPARLASLDIARGLAALSVVLWHWQHFFQGDRGELDRSTQPLYPWLHVFYETSAHYAVTFFFVLSGFVFFWLYASAVASRQCSAKEFALYRFARLYPLHAATLFAVLALQLVYLAQHGTYFVYQNNDAYHFALHTLFLSHWGFEKGHSFNAPVWSVSLEIGLYACFFVLAFLRGAKWVPVAAMVGFLIFVQTFGIGGRWPRAVEAFFTGGLTFFAIRAYLSRWPQRCLLDIPIAGLGLGMWVCMAVSPSFTAFILERDSAQLYSRLLFPATIASLVVLEARLLPNIEGLRWIGDISYSTYLIHFPLQILFVLVFSAFGFSAAVFLSPWVLLLFFVVLVLLSLVSFSRFERPVQNVIRTKYFPRRKTEASGEVSRVAGPVDVGSSRTS